MTESFAAQYKDIRFHMVSPGTLLGAEVTPKKGKKVSPHSVAREIFKKMTRP